MMKKNKAIGAPKNNARVFIIAIIILAIAGGVGVFELLSASKTTIYVFNDDYKAGTAISQDILTPVETETGLVIKFSDASGGKGYVTAKTLPELAGQYLTVDVNAGAPLVKSVTSEFGGSPAEVKLTDNNVALSVPVDNISVGGPEVLPGAFVNVYAGTTEGEVATEVLLLEKIKVLDVIYAQLQNDNTGAPVIEGATLEVAQADSVKLAKAVQFGTVRLGLVKATYEKAGNPFAETMTNVTGPETMPDGTAAPTEGPATK